MRYLPLLTLGCSVLPAPRPTYAVVEVNAPRGCDLRRMHEVFVDLDLDLDATTLRVRRGGPDTVLPHGPGHEERLRAGLLAARDRLRTEDATLGNLTLHVADDDTPLQTLIHVLDAVPDGFERVQLAGGALQTSGW